MTILHIIPAYKPAYVYGGPTVVVAQLAETLVKSGHQITVYTTTANGRDELDVIPNKFIEVNGVRVFYFSRVTKDHTQASPALWNYLNRTISDFDVVHIHSWWNFLAVGAGWICYKHNIKPILSPHGMFSNYIVKTNNPVWKQIIHKLIGKRLLKNTFLHVSTDMDWEEGQQIIKGWTGRIIPNLVTLSDRKYSRSKNDIFTIGFLSRIDPKKGLDVLIKALSRVKFPYKLLVAGAGNDAYVESLMELANQYGNSNNIEWIGWQNQDIKFGFLASLDLLALTSHSENFAVVVIESLSTGTPVLISNHVGTYKFVEQKDYGWITTMTPEKITNYLNNLVQEKEKIERINSRAPDEIKKEYRSELMIEQYLNFYEYVYEYNKVFSLSK